MATEKRAIVCSGGGAKGGYQIGAWKALRELDFTPDIVTGTSVGAMNGALIAADMYEEALEIWNTMGMERVFAPFDAGETDEISDIISFSFRFLRQSVLHGGANSKPLETLIRNMTDEKRLRSSPVRYGLVTTRYPRVKPVELFIDEISPGMVADYIIASAAAFPVMKSHKIGEETFIDGGYSDNMPVKMAIRGGATEVVAVNIGAMPSSATQGDNIKVHYIYAKRPLNDKFGGIFMFDKDLAKRNFQQGYLDVYKTFGLLDGHYYSFERYETYKTVPFERACRQKFEQSFCALPGVSMLEKRARSRVINFLRSYDDRPFEFNSNILHCAEAAAELFEISALEIYTLESFAREITDKISAFLHSEDYARNETALTRQISDRFSLKLLPALLEATDKKLLTAYCCRYLRQAIIPLKDKRKLWGIAAVFPEVYCAALFYLSALREFERLDAEINLFPSIDEEL